MAIFGEISAEVVLFLPPADFLALKLLLGAFNSCSVLRRWLKM